MALTHSESSPYRSPRPALQARLAELRLAWETTVESTLPPAMDVATRRYARIVAGIAAVLVQVAVLALVITWWTQREPVSLVPRGVPAEGYRCGLGPMVEAGVVMFRSAIELGFFGLLVAIAYYFGHEIGMYVGTDRVRRLVAPPDGSPDLELERLVHDSPARALAAAAARLEGSSVLWSLAAGGLPLVVVPLALSLQLGDGSEPSPGLFLAAALAGGLLLALAYTLARHAGRAAGSTRPLPKC